MLFPRLSINLFEDLLKCVFSTRILNILSSLPCKSRNRTASRDFVDESEELDEENIERPEAISNSHQLFKDFAIKPRLLWPWMSRMTWQMALKILKNKNSSTCRCRCGGWWWCRRPSRHRSPWQRGYPLLVPHNLHAPTPLPPTPLHTQRLGKFSLFTSG